VLDLGSRPLRLRGLNSEERLLHPMVKRAGEWAEVDWPEALEAAAQG
jgi:NADH-quinone oxidoreductase subunit G